MKKVPIIALLALCCLLLAGCGSVFDKEYVSVTDYVPPAQAENNAGGRVTVRNMAELKRAIMGMVYEGASGGSIAFDPNYDGSAAEDMESACWQVRTQDALCAYCVRDMSYEIEKIVNYYESTVSIDYTSYASELSSIIQLPYSVGVQDILSSAMEENRTRVVLLINTSTTTVENVKTMALDLYRSNPTLCVREPQMSVYMYSGSGRQRLYDVNFRYGMAEDELIRCKSQMKNLDVVSNLDAAEMDPLHAAFAACRYLTDNCVLDESAQGSCYDALIRFETNSEGLALAYVEMCHQLALECRIVYGQYDGSDHCWNIVKLDGDWYHVDVSRCYDGEFGKGFLLNDEQMWNDYRWIISSYPACAGELSYADISGAAAAETVFQPQTQENGETDDTQSEPEPTPEASLEPKPESTPEPTPGGEPEDDGGEDDASPKETAAETAEETDLREQANNP